MKKYYLLYCTVLYCSIDVLGCDCCRKLCGKSVIEKKTEWEFLKKYNTQEKRTNAWKTTLLSQNFKDDDVVPVVWEQHDKTKGCVLDESGEATIGAIPKCINVQTIYNKIFQTFKPKSLVLYFNGDPKLKYDGTQTTLGEKLIDDEDFLFNKESEDPLLQRAVFISYYTIRKGCCC